MEWTLFGVFARAAFAAAAAVAATPRSPSTIPWSCVKMIRAVPNGDDSPRRIVTRGEVDGRKEEREREKREKWWEDSSPRLRRNHPRHRQ